MSKQHYGILGLALFLMSAFKTPVIAEEKKPAPDLSEPFTDGSVWKGMSRQISEEKDKRMREATLRVTSREDKEFVAEYWVVVGGNQGNRDRRGLVLKGTVSTKGIIVAKPIKILAGAWQNDTILNEKWTGKVITEKEIVRCVIHRNDEGVNVEIGLIKQ